MSLAESCNYTTTQLQDALASLSTVDHNNRIELIHDCNHIHGFQSNSGSEDSNSTTSYFVEGHELSMLQTITARRVLDYNDLLVRLLDHFMIY